MANNNRTSGSTSHNISLQQAIELANRHHVNGNFQQAEHLYKQVLQAVPNTPLVLHLLGVLFHQQGKHEEAVKNISKAIKIKPDYADAHSNLGLALKALKKYERAANHFNKAIQFAPQFAEAHANLGITLHLLNKPKEAIDSLLKSISLKPDYINAFFSLGGVYQQQKQFTEAANCYQKILQLKPDHSEASNQLGLTLIHLEQFQEAINILRQCIERQPDNASSFYYLAAALEELGNKEGNSELIEQAAVHYLRAIDLSNEYLEAINRLAALYDKSGQLFKAIDYYLKSVEINPNNGKILINLGNIYLKLGKHEKAIHYYESALSKKHNKSAFSNLLMTLHYDPDISPEYIYQQHLSWAKTLKQTKKKNNFTNRHHQRLRIGYLSPDFRTHSVAYFFQPLLCAHNKNKFEIYCYHNAHQNDDMTHTLKQNSEHWRDIINCTDDEVIQQIKDDEIDILVDIAGHTAGNRLEVFARKAAPVQMTWLGYPNTTGLAEMNYRLIDDITDPVGESDAFNTEKLIRIPDGFLCYQGDESIAYQKDLPFHSRGYITFGSFNNLTKVNGQVIKLWAEILKAVPDSKLLLKSHQLQDIEVKENLISEFAALGIDQSRLELYGSLPNKGDHLNLYSHIDIGLDPFPYNGVTTTCEALWMGVPTITLSGNTHVGRVAASIMKQVGLTNFITHDTENYVQVAKSLAADPDYLSSLRSTLREKMCDSSLCDSQAFSKKIESIFHNIWNQHNN